MIGSKMALRDLFTMNQQILQDPENGHGVEVVYSSRIHGQVSMNAIREELQLGPADQQHARSIGRRATFTFFDSLIPTLDDDDVITEADGTRWTICQGGAFTFHEAGVWTVEFAVATLVNQGTRQHRNL